jgi:hypothetical protein
MRPENIRLVRNGLVAGAMGYGLIGMLFAMYNVLQGRHALHTAALFGNALLGRPSESIEVAPIAVYNGLHLLVLLAIGMAAAWTASMVERVSQLWYLLLFLGISAFFHLFGVVATLVAPSDAVPLTMVLVASLVAVLGMSAWLWRAYPGLASGVRAVGDFEDPPAPPGRVPKRS